MADNTQVEQEKKYSNRRVLIIIAIILLVVFIIGVIALGVFRIANRGADVIYYRYDIANKILTDESSLEGDNKTFIYRSENSNKFKEQIVFKSENNATLGIQEKTDSYIYGGKQVSMSFTIPEENHHLSTIAINKITASLNDVDANPAVLSKDDYEAVLDEENHAFNITIVNTSVLYIYNVVFGYSII